MTWGIEFTVADSGIKIWVLVQTYDLDWVQIVQDSESKGDGKYQLSVQYSFGINIRFALEES